MPKTRDENLLQRLGRLVYLAPVVAGAVVGAFINEVFTPQEVARGEATAVVFPLAQRFWQGAAIDASRLPGAASVMILSIAAAVAVWFALALAGRGKRRLAEALRRQAVAFIPFLSILVLQVLDGYAIVPGAMLLGIHAVVFSAAAFICITVALKAVEEKPPLARAVSWANRRGVVIVAVLAVVYWITSSVLGILQYQALNISYTDTADFEQMLWNTLGGRFLRTSAFGHMFFGEHVQFVHLLLLPFYALAPSLKTLMVLKSAALASGAFAVYLLARSRLTSKAAAVAFASAYLLYPAMQYVDLELAYNTFRPVAFAIPALLWAVYFLDRGKMAGFLIAAFLAVASKEEMALPVSMMGILLVVNRRRVWGAAVFAASMAWFFAAVLWVIPHFRGGPTHMYLYYLDFGEHHSFGSLFASIVFHPLHTLQVALRLKKIDYLLLLLVPLGLKPLFSWRMLLVMLPSLATTLLASRNPSSEIVFHYQAALVPFMVMGAVYGVANCAAIVERRRLVLSSQPPERRQKAVLAGLSAMVLMSAVFGNILFAQSPISLRFFNRHTASYWKSRYLPGERSRIFFAEVRPLVPAGASVSATEFVATAFAGREDDYVFPDKVGQVEYVVVDTRDRWLAGRLREKKTTLARVLSDGAYEKIYDNAGFLVYRKAPPAESAGN